MVSYLSHPPSSGTDGSRLKRTSIDVTAVVHARRHTRLALHGASAAQQLRLCEQIGVSKGNAVKVAVGQPSPSLCRRRSRSRSTREPAAWSPRQCNEPSTRVGGTANGGFGGSRRQRPFFIRDAEQPASETRHLTKRPDPMQVTRRREPARPQSLSNGQTMHSALGRVHPSSPGYRYCDQTSRQTIFAEEG